MLAASNWTTTRCLEGYAMGARKTQKSEGERQLFKVVGQVSVLGIVVSLRDQ